MPDKRAHRGPHPEDGRLFAPEAWPALREATADLCWLLSRRYALPSATKLVGDRYQLQQRQRVAVARCACSEEACQRRATHRTAIEQLRGGWLLIDGYNVLTSIEAALAGGVILAARDGCYRDMASVHGTFRCVEETAPALELLGTFLIDVPAAEVVWYLDSPVSNSGRLRGMILTLAQEHGWNWRVELVNDPDRRLSQAADVVATTDSAILDRCQNWLNLAREVIDAQTPGANIVDLSGMPPA